MQVNSDSSTLQSPVIDAVAAEGQALQAGCPGGWWDDDWSDYTDYHDAPWTDWPDWYDQGA